MAAMANRFVGPSGAMLVLLAVVQCILATPQRTAAFSLQAAVDELHRREAAKYPLNAPPQPALDDWDEGELGGLGESGREIGFPRGKAQTFTFAHTLRRCKLIKQFPCNLNFD